MAALYAMKAVLDSGVPLKREVRLILGCDEETGMEDITYYTKHFEPAQGRLQPRRDVPRDQHRKGDHGASS